MAEGDYPVSQNFKVLGGYDIYRSEKLIVAIVAVESSFGKDVRLYRWQKRGSKDSGPTWKVDLARMSVARWDWNEIAKNVVQMKHKFGIGQPKEEAD
jgi:hypothetical protein